MNSFTSRPTAGIDWGSESHACAVVESNGAALEEFDVDDSSVGIAMICKRFKTRDVERVAIERPDGPVVEALVDAGFGVVVVSSRAVKGLRSRYGLSGNKCDATDAFILADCLRTDGHRWPNLEVDSPATRTLRSHVRARKMLIDNRIAVANQLRAHLETAFPGAIGLFSEIDNQISLKFVQRFPTQQAAGWLSPKRLEAWLRSNNYNFAKPANVLYEHLQNAPQGSLGLDYETIITSFVHVLMSICSEIKTLDKRIKKLFEAHPDAFIFESLPRSGMLRAATLLAEIGDCRSRYPDAQTLACHSGMAPSTRQSGKYLNVTFRYSADAKLRNAICDFAGDSWQGNAWAADRYWKLRQSGKTHQHAVRILGRSWLSIIWRCWQDRQPYDPDKHGGFRRLGQEVA